MGARRAHKEGSLHQRKDGRWVGVLDLGWADGKRQRRYFYGKTQQEAAKALQEAKTVVETGGVLPDKRSTVGTYLGWWAGEDGPLTGSVKASTADDYRAVIVRYILPTLGEKKLGTLSGTEVQAMMAALTRRGLSARTQKYARAVLRRSLADALRLRLVAHNACDGVRAPRIGEARTDDALTVDEAKRLLAAAKGHRLEAFITVAMTAGLRRGEALALTWDDVNFEAGTIRVGGTVKRRAREGLYVDTTKTKTSTRTAEMPATTAEALRQHKVRQAKERLQAGDKWQDGNYVFTHPLGGLLDPSNLTQQYHRITEAAGLGKRRLHGLRHTSAALMLAQGVPLEVVSKALGHAGYAITADIYGHIGQEAQRKAADAMDGLFRAAT